MQGWEELLEEEPESNPYKALLEGPSEERRWKSLLKLRLLREEVENRGDWNWGL